MQSCLITVLRHRDEGNPDLQRDLDTPDPVSDLICSNRASTSQSVCTCLCCSDEVLKALQSTSREILASLAFNGRNFVASSLSNTHG